MTLYNANNLKLPFFRYSNKNFITTIPTKKLTNTPNKNSKEKMNSLNFNIVAPNTIGADNIKENFAVDSLSTPIALPVVIVIPERETPGIKARACEKPIIKVCFKVSFS